MLFTINEKYHYLIRNYIKLPQLYYSIKDLQILVDHLKYVHVTYTTQFSIFTNNTIYFHVRQFAGL